MNSHPSILITICARQGSKGLATKNILPFLGKPLIAHTIECARLWNADAPIVVSTDGEAIAQVAREYGATVPFMRPAELATDSAGKIPVITHALIESEKHFGKRFDVVLDLDPTAPVRSVKDLELGWETFQKAGTKVCFSVVKARKNPYFNMVERDEAGKIRVVKPLAGNVLSRQAAPQVYDLNASIYFYQRDFLLTNPQTLWEGNPEIFEMSPESAFDIDHERDLIITQALMKHLQEKNQ